MTAAIESVDKKPNTLLTWANRVEKFWAAAFAGLAFYELTMTNVPVPANLILALTVLLAGFVVNRNIEDYKQTL